MRGLIRESPTSWSPLHAIQPIPLDIHNPRQRPPFRLTILQDKLDILRSPPPQPLQFLHEVLVLRARGGASTSERLPVWLDEHAAHTGIRSLRAVVICWCVRVHSQFRLNLDDPVMNFFSENTHLSYTPPSPSHGRSGPRLSDGGLLRWVPPSTTNPGGLGRLCLPKTGRYAVFGVRGTMLEDVQGPDGS